MSHKFVVEYKGLLLMPGSVALALYQDKKDPDHMKKLDVHLKEVNTRYHDMMTKARGPEKAA